MSNCYDANRSACIVSNVLESGAVKTETSRRDEGADSYSMLTDSTNATKLVAKLGAYEVTFNGREARTLYRLLRKHYNNTGKSLVG